MLGQDRVKEAEENTKSYLREGLLRKTSPDKNILRLLRDNSKESLNVAGILLKNNHSSLWTIVCSYYSMYYIANAALYSQGLKVGPKIPHKVTSDALIVHIREKLADSLFLDYDSARDEALGIAGLRADEIIGYFDMERNKRSRFQYGMTEDVKRAKAETSLERAKRFVYELEKLLD